MAGPKLLVSRVAAFHLPCLLFDEFLLGRRQAFASAVAHTLVANLERSVQMQETEITGGTQYLDFPGIANRVDDEISVGPQLALHPVGQDRRPELGAKLIAHRDEILPRRCPFPPSQFGANLVRQRVELKALGLEMVGGNGFPGAIRTR